MRVVAALLDYPPHRYIGSELMTHAMLKRLRARGHDVTVVGKENKKGWSWDGINVVPRPIPEADVLIYHAEFWEDNEASRPWVDRWAGPKVAICHNSRIGVQVGIVNCPPTLLTVNSELMRTQLRHPRPMVVHPPLEIPENPVTGDRVTVINMEATNKVGPFWELAATMPDVQFLGVLGGYGEQSVPDVIPANVELIDQVAPSDMAERVWARTRILLVPSATESWSMVASEAMSYGIPVVANPLPSLKENMQGVAVWADRDQTWQWDQGIRMVLRAWDEFSVVVRRRAVEQAERWNTEVEAWCDEVERIGHGGN